MQLPPLIFDTFEAEVVPPVYMDRFWAEGWRHFGSRFFRYSVSESLAPEPLNEEGGPSPAPAPTPGPGLGLGLGLGLGIWTGEAAAPLPGGFVWQTILPLRIDLRVYEPTKSQRRVLRRNADLSAVWAPAARSDETNELFARHRVRFKDNLPEHLGDFLGDRPGLVPCACLELQCRLGGRLVAASYLDLGKTAVSSVYGLFEPAESRRSPGIYTLLLELEWARQQGFQYHYPGYAMTGPSHYDYKKQFRGLEGYDWGAGEWRGIQ